MTSNAYFEQVFVQEADFVARSLLRLGVATRDADDQLQEVFVVLARNIDSFDRTRSARPYLWGVCRRIARDYRELARHRGVLSDDFDQETHDGRGPESHVQARDAQRMVQSALQKLPEQRRTAFILYELEGMTLAEIAAIEDVSIHTVASRVRKARDEFASAVRRRPYGSDSVEMRMDAQSA